MTPIRRHRSARRCFVLPGTAGLRRQSAGDPRALRLGRGGGSPDRGFRAVVPLVPRERLGRRRDLARDLLGAVADDGQELRLVLLRAQRLPDGQDLLHGCLCARSPRPPSLLPRALPQDRAASVPEPGGLSSDPAVGESDGRGGLGRFPVRQQLHRSGHQRGDLEPFLGDAILPDRALRLCDLCRPFEESTGPGGRSGLRVRDRVGPGHAGSAADRVLLLFFSWASR